MRNIVGWSYIGITGLVIAISVGGLIINLLIEVYTKMRDKFSL